VIFEFLTLLQADPAKDNGESDPCTSFPIRHARRIWMLLSLSPICRSIKVGHAVGNYVTRLLKLQDSQDENDELTVKLICI